ncbi:MAG: PD-(D/E)XK nuclease family protein [Oscillospiraceae bacterium]|nr:PD-(D/E)XK nuclease family protein [Oscillospiraceae bacterium]
MIRFEKIAERDIDLIMMRCFIANSDFAELFLKCLGLSGAKLIHVEHSLTDPELGESDVTVIVESDSTRYALLIENKIDANAMPQQYHRYDERGRLGVANGEYADYAVFIVAPQSYLDTNDEAKKYPNRISYETMLDFFECKGFVFEREAIRCAIRKKESGYTVQAVPSITEFWGNLYAYTSASKYRCEMFPPDGPKGSRSAWVQFRVPLHGVSLYFKSSKGFVDLEFTGKLNDGARLRAEINPHKGEDMHWETTGNSLSLRLRVRSMDFRNPFSEYINDVDQVLSAAERLTALAVKLNDLGFTV